MHLLLIEDDRRAADYLAKALGEVGYVIDHAADGTSGLAMAAEQPFDLIILDRGLPGMDGLSIIEALRSKGVRTPILVVSVLSKVDDRVRGLRAGGDDYITKPYAFSELLARVEVLLKPRGTARAETMLRVADLELDLLSRTVRRAGKHIALKPREFQLLEYLMRREGQLVTRTMLLEGVWDYHFDPQSNVVDVHIGRIRQAIDKDFDPPLLRTVRGAGYVLAVPR